MLKYSENKCLNRGKIIFFCIKIYRDRISRREAGSASYETIKDIDLQGRVDVFCIKIYRDLQFKDIDSIFKDEIWECPSKSWRLRS